MKKEELLQYLREMPNGEFEKIDIVRIGLEISYVRATYVDGSVTDVFYDEWDEQFRTVDMPNGLT